MRSSILSGNSMGRKDNVWGQIGVIRRAGICGWTRDPPADSYNIIVRDPKSHCKRW
jgi:hypothetical protein